MITALQAAGLSHSEILGSKIICIYPRLIAAYHVLHRLREPRHPPDALTCFRRIYHLYRNKGDIAHTFSCKLRVLLYFTQFLNLKSLLTVLCVNMSKNDSELRIENWELRIMITCFPYPFTSRVGEVENNGFEPLTPCLQSRCSSQLS